MVEDIVCLGAVLRAQLNWGRAAADSRGIADLLGVAGPTDVEVHAPDRLEEGPVHCRG